MEASQNVKGSHANLETVNPGSPESERLVDFSYFFVLKSSLNNISSDVEFQRRWVLKRKLYGQESTYVLKRFFFLLNPSMNYGLSKSVNIVQWNLDLRKILGVDKIFLKSRFFLISNTLKVTSKGNDCKMNT